MVSLAGCAALSFFAGLAGKKRILIEPFSDMDTCPASGAVPYGLHAMYDGSAPFLLVTHSRRGAKIDCELDTARWCDTYVLVFGVILAFVFAMADSSFLIWTAWTFSNDIPSLLLLPRL